MEGHDALRRTAGLLLARGGRLTEAQEGGSRPLTRRETVEAVETLIRRRLPVGLTELDPAVAFLAETIVGDGLRELDASAAVADPIDRDYLELIVESIGRPVLRITPTGVESPPNAIGENTRWKTMVAMKRPSIGKVAASVGRIALNGVLPEIGHLGTAWRTGTDLVVTNRHVLEWMVKNPERRAEEWTLDPERPAHVDFGFDNSGSPGACFPVAAIAHCSSGSLDLAILRLADRADMPAALPVARDPSFLGGEVYVLGHPFRAEPESLVRKVFRDADGRKRCSPGVITGIDAAGTIFFHDCSTLGGNSGSCIVSADTHEVVGLHFGGHALVGSNTRGIANLGIDFSALRTKSIWADIGSFFE